MSMEIFERDKRGKNVKSGKSCGGYKNEHIGIVRKYTKRRDR